MTNWGGVHVLTRKKKNEYLPFTITIVIAIVIDTAATTMIIFNTIVP